MEGVAGSGALVDWPFLSMILSAADPEPNSLSSGVVPEGENGLTRPQVDQWFVRLGCKSPIVFKDFWIPTFGCINDFRCALLADVVRINWTLLCSRRYEQCLARCDVHKDELSCTGYRNCLTVHANTRDLVTLRCALDGHVQVPHLANAQEDQYSSLFKDADVGAAWRCRMIPKVPGPLSLHSQK